MHGIRILLIVLGLLAVCRAWAAQPVVFEAPTASPSQVMVPADVIVLQSDFENDPAAAGWGASEIARGASEPAAIPLEWTDADAHGGSHCLSATRGMIVSGVLPTKACVIYRLRFWGKAAAADAKASSRPQGKWGLRFYDARGQVVWEGIYCGPFTSSEWLRYGAKIMCPQWVTRMKVAFWPENGARIFVDDVELAEDAEANAFDKETPPPISYNPEPDRWRYLPNTMKRLRAGGPLKVVVLGDSIANDLSNSGFNLMLEKLYPRVKIELIRSVLGSVGWEYFSTDEHFKEAVEVYNPDLVIVSGMSDRDVKFLHALIAQIRAKTKAEPLVLNGQVCQTYPLWLLRPPPEGRRMPIQQRERLRTQVTEAGREDQFAVFNLGGVFDEFIYYSDIPMEWWQRDTSHLNDRGKQLIGRMLALFFDPAVKPVPPDRKQYLLLDGFEADPAKSGWTVSDDFAGGWNDEQSNTGLRSVKVSQGVYKSAFQPITPSAIYRVTFASLARAGGYWSLIGFDKKGEICGGACSGIYSNGNWTANEFFFTGPAGAVKAQFWFHPTTAEFYVDDVAIQPATRAQWLAWADAQYAALPPVDLTPPADRWQHLPKTLQKIRNHKPLRILVIGDSVANDLADTDFHLWLERQYGGTVTLADAVDGGAGCEWFLQENRVQKLILSRKPKPDLLIIAGMSTKSADAARQLVRAVRAKSDMEVLLVSGVIVQQPYRDALKPAADGGFPTGPDTALRQQFAQAAAEDGFAFFDLGGVWDRYILVSPMPLDFYKRDASHVNTRGRMVVGQIMLSFFTPDDVRAASTTTPVPGTTVTPAKTTQPFIEVTGTILRASRPLSYEKIAPYTMSYRTLEIQIDAVLDGKLDAKKVIAVHMAMKDKKLLPAAGFTPGMRLRLKLGLWDDVEHSDTLPVGDDLDVLDATWYYVAACEPVK